MLILDILKLMEVAQLQGTADETHRQEGSIRVIADNFG